MSPSARCCATSPSRTGSKASGNITLDVTTAGETVNAMKRALNGTAKVAAARRRDQGHQHRRDHPQGAQHARRLAAGGAEAKAPTTRRRRRISASSTPSFAIKNGVAHNEDLDVKAPLFRLGGAGDINIGNSTLDYLAKASHRRHAQGQGGKERDNLAGLTVPVQAHRHASTI